MTEQDQQQPDRRRKRPELPDLTDYLVAIGQREIVAAFGVPPDRANHVMRQVAQQLLSTYARHQFYVPAGYDARNAEIWAKYGQASATAAPYTQDRILELAHEYELTARQVYNIVGVQRARQLADERMPTAQPTLPGLDT